MNGKKSKFRYEIFHGYPDGCSCLIVNRDVYSEEQAKELFRREYEDTEEIEIEEATVRYGAGIDEDGERFVGWWVDWDADGNRPRRCPVWILY